jgi:hypothetical protein
MGAFPSRSLGNEKGAGTLRVPQPREEAAAGMELLSTP